MKCIVRRSEYAKKNENSNLSEKSEAVAPLKATKVLGENIKLKQKLDEKKLEPNGPVNSFSKDDTSYINLKIYNLDKNVFTLFCLKLV